MSESSPGSIGFSANKKLVILASGAGSNAEKIIQKLGADRVAAVVTNRAEAGVIEVARRYNVPVEVLSLKDTDPATEAHAYLTVLDKYHPDLIVLAGYLKKIPPEVTRAYSRRIVNIHPALLPKFGGPGMYGQRVHEAVIAGGEKESGISIHYVDEWYDHGEIILQANCALTANETAASLAEKIHALEHEHFPEVVARLLDS